MHSRLQSTLGELAEPLMQAQSFNEVAQIGLRFLTKNPPERGYGMVIGVPLELEGIAARYPNFHVLGSSRVARAVADRLKREGDKPMFDWGLFTPRLFELYQTWVDRNPKDHTFEFCDQLLTDFFEPMLRCEVIRRLYYVRGAAGQRGTLCLLALGQELKKNIYLLEPSYVRMEMPPIESMA